MWKFFQIALVVIGLLVAGLVLAANLVPGKALEYSSAVRIELPVDRAWLKMKDLSQAHEYVPGLLRTEITSAAPNGMDASRRVYSSETDYINETVVAWEEGEGFTLALQDDNGLAPSPFGQASFRYQVKSDGAGASLVSGTLRCTLRGGVVGEWLARSLLAAVLQGRVDAVAAGLKVFYERD